MNPSPGQSAHDTHASATEDALAHLLVHAFTKEEAARALVALQDAHGPGTGVDLHALTRALAKVPTATLYVPVPLTATSVAELARWCRREIGERLLLDVRVDTAATGGCLLAWGGVLHDFSLSYFLERKGADYTALLERVLAPAVSKAQPVSS